MGNRYVDHDVLPEPSDAVVDSAGDVWFTVPLDASVDRLDPETGSVTAFPVSEASSSRKIAALQLR